MAAAILFAAAAAAGFAAVAGASGTSSTATRGAFVVVDAGGGTRGHRRRQRHHPFSSFGAAAAFVPSASRPSTSSPPLSELSALPDSFRQQPGESSSSYMKRLQALASDPKAFERQRKQETASVESAGASSSPHRNAQLASTAMTPSNGTDASVEDGQQKEKRGGYQRGEDWDREQEDLRKQMSWEERVQFDGQRHGNGFRQNEILRHHLNTY